MAESHQLARPPIESYRAAENDVPAGVLKAVAVVIGLSLGLAFVARQTDIGATRLSPAPAVASRELSVTTTDLGDLLISDARTGETVKQLPAKSDGFIKIVLRGIHQERTLHALPQDGPLRLSRLTDGKTILHDPTTNRIIIVSAFGPANAEAFANLLEGDDQ